MKSYQRNGTKKIRPLVFSFLPIIYHFNVFCIIFHVVSKISNFNKSTAKYLEQTSCTELTLFPRMDIWLQKTPWWQLAAFSSMPSSCCCLRMQHSNKTPRSEDWMAYATQGMALWPEFPKFAQKSWTFF